ncbi:MAG: gliding motility-associated C-terminal domain-containing protein [Flavobacteriales bacterium]
MSTDRSSERTWDPGEYQFSLQLMYHLLPSLSQQGYRLCIALWALCAGAFAWGQQMIWTDTFNGGVVVGAFSIGDQGWGMGMIENALPAGATIRHATLYAVSIGGVPDDSLSLTMGSLPISFGPSTAGPVFQSTYGPVVLHQRDLTGLLDPAMAMYTITLEGGYTTFNEFTLVTAYELPGAAPVTVDIFHCGADSQLEENYTIHTSHPMSTAGPIAFGTMGAYALNQWYDYETVSVNGVELGKFYGRDYNAGPGNNFGASATFHYAHGIFEGVGDDDPDVAILGADVLSDLAPQVPDGTQILQVTYRHSPTLLPAQQADNIVNMIVLAYSAAPCDNTPELLGPDTTLCPGDTLVLDATRNGASYIWQDGSTSPTFTVTAPGTYHVQWTHPECSWDPDTIVVGMVNVPSPELGPDQELCGGEAVLLGTGSTPIADVAWSDGNADWPRSVTSSGLYTLTLTANSCSVSDSILITVVDCTYDVELPNVFTPNGDGNNDLFKPINIQGVASLSFRVYNRWGQEVFHTTGPGSGWDGRTLSGKQVPAGTYYWILEHTAKHAPSTPVTMHGTVTLLR